MEKGGLRGKWQRLSYKLHTYWYYRGLIDELRTRENLLAYFRHEPVVHEIKNIEIDLEKGMEAAETLIDKERPHTLTIRSGIHEIATISYKPGAERLKGAHLRRILATAASKPLMNTLALKALEGKSSS